MRKKNVHKYLTIIHFKNDNTSCQGWKQLFYIVFKPKFINFTFLIINVSIFKPKFDFFFLSYKILKFWVKKWKHGSIYIFFFFVGNSFSFKGPIGNYRRD